MATRRLSLCVVAILLACGSTAFAHARRDEVPVNPDDPTTRLFQVLDSSYAGRLQDFCLPADIYTDPTRPGQLFQHVLRVDYDKRRFFGRLRISVRGVSQLTPGQLQEYSPAQLYSFGSDVERFEKIDPGPFGEAGDLCVRLDDGGVLRPVRVTDEVQRQYDAFLTRYILPALKRKRTSAPL